MLNQTLINDTVQSGAGKLSSSGALLVETGKHTGRAAKNRYVVRRKAVEDSVDWGDVNRAVPEDFAEPFFEKIAQKVLQGKEPAYEMKAFVGPFHVEVHSTSPWHIAFANNMFRQSPVKSVLEATRERKPIQIFHDPFGSLEELGLVAPDGEQTMILVDPAELKIGIVGTAYAGEIKKSAFSLANFLLPEDGLLPMHSSANCKTDGSGSCVLFGLSGTGKTTLSASSDRALIGDDEIVWTDQGLSNLEGGCYAKLIDLDPQKEPEIFAAVNQHGAILENVGYTEDGKVDFTDRSRTENTRGSYGLEALPSIFDQTREADVPNTVVFLTADAFGALPAVAKLDRWQAQYHFISGYTAKVAGTEMGVQDPVAAFSACFGAPFMPRHPSVYAKMLAERVERSGATVWLLNTGWTEGGFGKGPRFPISLSRRLLEAIQSGELEKVEMTKHPIFGFEVPASCAGVDESLMKFPSGEPVKALARKFLKNMEKFSAEINPKVVELGGPTV